MIVYFVVLKKRADFGESPLCKTQWYHATIITTVGDRVRVRAICTNPTLLRYHNNIIT